MTADDVVRFSDAFGGKYYVQKKGEFAALDLPVAYENSSYVIYQIP
jgi:hypothetical protein